MSVVSYLKLTPKQEFLKQFQQEMDELTRLARGQKGFIKVEVLRPLNEATTYVVLSEWESEADFKAWEHSPRHQQVMDDFNQRIGQGYSTMRMTRYR
ncbi:MAG: antibiotic biosynthesis monooxygenase [Chloroflexi bacterium]|nr:antibiotic biosynthesis monooxygenase [Chloroflexota bacterium]